MSDLIKKIEILNANKDKIVEKVKRISADGITKTQAQNLREYATRTNSIDEIMLYIDYQCAREKKENREKFKRIGEDLKNVIAEFKTQDIGYAMEFTRYFLGTFCRWVTIKEEAKNREAEKKKNQGYTK